jgi:hypothetical protein
MRFSLRLEQERLKGRGLDISFEAHYEMLHFICIVVELYRVVDTLVNLCVTYSEMMHLTLSCEVHRF